MEVASDAVALVQQRRHVLRVASGRELEGERGLRGQGFCERELGAVELGCANLTEQDEDTGRYAARPQGRVEGRSEGRQLGDAHRLRARHRVDDHAGALVQHAHRAAFGWESQAQQTGGVLAVDDFGGPGVAHGLQDDDGGVRVGHFAHGLGNEFERLLLIGALQHGGRQRLRGADPPCGALRVRVQVRVFDGDAGGGRERAEDSGIGG